MVASMARSYVKCGLLVACEVYWKREKHKILEIGAWSAQAPSLCLGACHVILLQARNSRQAH